MNKYRITKIVKAKDFISALQKEHKVQPVEITQLHAEEKEPREVVNAIGFQLTAHEDDDDSDGGE